MTIDAAQIELLKVLSGGSSSSPALASLLGGLGGGSAGGGLLGQVLTGNAGAAVAGSSLLGGAVGGVLSGGASGVAGGVLGLSPILAGLRALFGGGAPEALPVLSKYVAPDSLALSLGVSNGGQNLGAASYGQNGAPRVAPAITVNVNAIDSQSFADHSDAIAQVVRAAMLNSGALTDVVAEI